MSISFVTVTKKLFMFLQVFLCADADGNKFIVKAVNGSKGPWNTKEVNLFGSAEYLSFHARRGLLLIWSQSVF